MPSDRLDRFARHIVLPEIGGAGQVALGRAQVAVVGLGGIGSPVVQYLAAAGVGALILIDDDVVEASNLQRQTIFAEADIGSAKVDVARAWAVRFDPSIEVRICRGRIGRDNAAKMLDGGTVIVDGCDNFATRLAVSDACVAAQTPLVSAAVGRFQGQVGAFAGHLAGQPCYRCFVGDAFDAEDCDSCAEDGMLGAMAGWAGTFAALAAVRVILAAAGVGGMGDPQFGQLHVLDGLAPALRSLRIAKDPECRGCSAA
ncbi:molybdopterin biosynthesis protein MoeB [Novosphingobium sp. Gsoil 351]|nr:molybdopterin biosynthesis protein MoeB [Novosphingobium sp. Gsoil 351]